MKTAVKILIFTIIFCGYGFTAKANITEKSGGSSPVVDFSLNQEQPPVTTERQNPANEKEEKEKVKEDVKTITPNQPARIERPKNRPRSGARPEVVRPERGGRPEGAGRPAGAGRPGRN
jgi:hypothetical protein